MKTALSCSIHVLNLEKTSLKQVETNQGTDRLGYGGTERSWSPPPTFHTISEPQKSTEESHRVRELPGYMLSLFSRAAGDWAHLRPTAEGSTLPQNDVSAVFVTWLCSLLALYTSQVSRP